MNPENQGECVKVLKVGLRGFRDQLLKRFFMPTGKFRAFVGTGKVRT
jgi:hypothetical protein